MPPRSQSIIGLYIFFLVMAAFLFTFVERMLYADVCFYISTGSLLSNKTRYIESARDLDLTTTLA